MATISVPRANDGFAADLKKRYFSSPGNSILTVISAALLGVIIWNIVDWAIIHAVWSADAAEACKRDGAGACWSVIAARWRLIIFGL